MYAATDRGLYRTLDAGSNWTRASARRLVDIALVPGSALVYGCLSDKLLKSTDAGRTFSPIYVLDGSCGTVAVDPVAPQTVYATFQGFASGVFVTHDAGITWSRHYFGYYDAPAITIDPRNHQVVFIGVDFGVMKSIDQGATWLFIGVPVADWVSGISIDPTASRRIVATGIDVPFLSTDHGQTWLPIPTDGLVADWCYATVFDGANGIVHLATSDGVFEYLL